MPCLSLRWIFALLWLLAGSAWATAYSLPAATFAACSGTWISSSNTCQNKSKSENGKVTLQVGDTVIANQSLTIYADGGFELKGNNTLGSSSASVSLQTDYGLIVIAAGSTIYGSLISGSGTQSLSGVQVNGSVSGNGSATFTNSSIAGTVTMKNGLTASGTTFSSTLTSTNGAVSLSGGSVAGLVNVGCCQVTVSGGATISNGILAGNNGITISDSTVSGALNAGNNPINLTNVTMTSGSINPGSNNVTISGGNITASITDANNVYIQQGATVTGDVQARYTVTVTASTLTGDIYGSAGYTLQHVYLKQSSTIYGDVTVGTSWQTIEGDSSANHIYGVCTYASVNPASLCQSAPSSPVHHYQLAYASQALTCQAQTVTVSACADAACSTRYTSGTSSLAVSPGGSAISFVGSTTTSIAVRSAQTVSLAVSNASPAAVNATLCSIDGGTPSSNCNLTFADSGLLVQAPDLIAGKADTLTVTAVRTSDNSASCVPAFAKVSRPVQFWSTYVSPNEGSSPVLLGGSAISGNRGSPTTLTLNFNASGQAPLLLNYADAGQVQIDARYVGSSASGDVGLTMDGADTFISRPYGLHLSTDASCSAASVAGCTVLRAAGDSFQLRIRAVAWQADGEPRTAAKLADNPSTPNFRLSDIAVASTLVAPAGGDNGSLSRASCPVSDSPTSCDLSESEVGVFTISATPPSGGYFGYTVDGGQSDLVGRFTPAYLDVSASAQLKPPSCLDASGKTVLSVFSYQGQPIEFAIAPLLTVTGHNRQGGVTRNYDRGDFWRLSAPQREAYQSITGRSSLDVSGRLQSLGNAQSAAVGDTPGDGARQFGWADDRLLWTAALAPLDDDLPFPSVAGTAIARLTLPAAQLSDADGICYASGGCTDFSYDFGGSEVRLGRLRFGNAFGSELQALDVPFWLESWQRVATSSPQGAFRTESADSCSAPSLGNPALLKVAGALQTADLAGAAVSAPSLGVGAVHLPAPGAEGSVSVGLSGLEGSPPLLPWLLYDWSGSAKPEEGRGLATFGVYKGSDALIFRRESYR